LKRKALIEKNARHKGVDSAALLSSRFNLRVQERSSSQKTLPKGVITGGKEERSWDFVPADVQSEGQRPARPLDGGEGEALKKEKERALLRKPRKKPPVGKREGDGSPGSRRDYGRRNGATPVSLPKKKTGERKRKNRKKKRIVGDTIEKKREEKSRLILAE